jgi:hypothetical protein
MQLAAMEDKKMVEAFPFQTANEALADVIGLWGLGWCQQGANAGVFE